MTAAKIAPTKGRPRRVARLILILMVAAGTAAAGCTPIPPGVAAQATVDGPVDGRALQRALEADAAVANVRANPYVAREHAAAARRPPDDYRFDVPAYTEAWGQLSTSAGRGRSTHVRARVSWPHNGMPSYRQKGEIEDLVRRLVGRTLMAPTDPTAPPAASPAPAPAPAPGGPSYWSGGR